MSGILNPSFFAAKGAPPQQIIYDRMLQQDSVHIVHACVGETVFQEAKNPLLKVAIPFGQASIHACWQTAAGQQKWQHVRAGHVSIMPAAMPYETNWQCRAEILILCLQPQLLATLAEELAMGDRLEIIEHWTAHDLLIQQLGLDLRAELQRGSPSLLYIDACAIVLATHLLRQYSTAQPLALKPVEGMTHARTAQIKAYIHENLESELSLAELAQVVNMNLYRFARTFKQTFGISPHQYVLKQRIERARFLLAHTDLTLQAISYQLGFSSQSHFTTAFRRAVGVTPKAFRAAQ
ncbi:MAG TPA: AraC family transcriptional regulator [Coleofasciculaceae cyanobacterium]|jgi:AraC family transcriptional regulator